MLTDEVAAFTGLLGGLVALGPDTAATVERVA